MEVTKHALNWYEQNIRKVKFVLTVYPTALMLSEFDICKAMEILEKDKKCDSIMSATNFSFPIQRAVYKKIITDLPKCFIQKNIPQGHKI